MSNFVHYQVKDRVAVLTIDNPPVNALGQGVWEAIDEAVARASNDADADAIVLIGAGSTFVAGADINIFKTLKTREQSLERSGRHARDAASGSRTRPSRSSPRFTATRSAAGSSSRMACHFRVATADAKVGQPEVLLGIIPGAGGTQRLPRLAGAELALEMCTDGKPVAAPKAQGRRHRRRDRRRRSARRARSPSRRRAPRRTRSGETRDIVFSADGKATGLEARVEGARRAQGSRRACGAPFAAIDAIEAALTLDFDAGSLRERELFADCVVSTESKALRHLFFAEREARRCRTSPKETADARHQARGGRRRRHDGRRHRDELRERRHSGPAEGRGRGGARARPGDDPQELRVVGRQGPDDARGSSTRRWRSSRRRRPTTASTRSTSSSRRCSRTWI